MPTQNAPLLPACDEYDPNSLSYEEAINAVLTAIEPVLESECVEIRQALGRLLAEPVYSRINVPSHTNSAMDGFAIAGDAIPAEGTASFRLKGSVFAGAPLQGTIGAGECARIMTGGKMPDGTDTVIMQEHAQLDGDVITISHGHKPGQYVRQAGEDLKVDDLVFAAGKRLTPADIGMLASLGIGQVSVIRSIRVAFFSTGDELREIGQPLGDGQIYDSNRYTLYSMLTRLGTEVIDMGIIPDQREAVESAFRDAARQADVLITSGGVSVGAADFVKETLEKLGRTNFWKIAMKPGRPLAFGKIDNCYFFGLPGNPVSSMITFYQFVQPAILRLMGIEDVSPTYIDAKCEAPLKKVEGRLEFQRGILRTNEQGELVVKSTGGQGSGLLNSMSKANCFIVLPVECKGVKAGGIVKVQPFDSLI